MNLLVALIIPVMLGFRLRKNYSDDPGQHTKAKIVHAVLTTILGFAYFGSISKVIWFTKNMMTIFQTTGPVGILSGEIHLLYILSSTAVGVVFYFMIFRMAFRSEPTRNIMVKLYPAMGIISSIGFYLACVSAEYDLLMADWLILSLCFVIMMTFFLGCMVIYQSDWMIRFFNQDPEFDANASVAYEDLVEDIGHTPEN